MSQVVASRLLLPDQFATSFCADEASWWFEFHVQPSARTMTLSSAYFQPGNVLRNMRSLTLLILPRSR